MIYEVNAHGNRSGQLISKDALKPGRVRVVLSVTPSPSKDRVNSLNQPVGLPPISLRRRSFGYYGSRYGEAQLEINGQFEGKSSFTNINGSSYTETLDVGADLGTAVSPDYSSPYRFTGKIDHVKVDLK